jgi:hypothetical protein
MLILDGINRSDGSGHRLEARALFYRTGLTASGKILTRRALSATLI